MRTEYVFKITQNHVLVAIIVIWIALWFKDTISKISTTSNKRHAIFEGISLL